MRVSNTYTGRPAYYDRAPANGDNYAQTAALAPAALTTDWTYTVPSNRKAFMTAAFVSVHRVTAAAPVGRQRAVVLKAPAIGNQSVPVEIRQYSNTVDAIDTRSTGVETLMVAGDVVTGRREDLSTGGTVDFTTSAQIVEFDA